MKLYKHYDLIRKPIITEKTTNLSELNKFTFEVASFAEKPAVKKAIESIFEVKVKTRAKENKVIKEKNSLKVFVKNSRCVGLKTGHSSICLNFNSAS